MLEKPLTLACGVTLPNRVAKAALSEQLAAPDHGPSEGLIRLYETWGRGGAGLLVTGNVMVDPSSLGEPANVVVADDRHMDRLRRWAAGTKAGGSVALAQVNHPGRQSPRSLSPKPVSPSAVPMSGLFGAFATPRALTVPEIQELVAAYARTSRLLVEAGFDGVQLHGAHGYLVSQFLSPLVNLRTDEYGGSLEGRARFLMELVAATRDAIGPEKMLAVKINSADFQRGGFQEDDALAVGQRLADAGIDLLEISGGTYEANAMMGVLKESTKAREAYFLDFAERLRAAVDLPLMVSGGFRTRAGMEAALTSGAVDVIGLGRPFAVEPDLARRLLAGDDERIELPARRVGLHRFDGMAETVWYTTQLWRIGAGRSPALDRPSAVGVAHYFLRGQAPAVGRAAGRRALHLVRRG